MGVLALETIGRAALITGDEPLAPPHPARQQATAAISRNRDTTHNISERAVASN